MILLIFIILIILGCFDYFVLGNSLRLAINCQAKVLAVLCIISMLQNIFPALIKHKMTSGVAIALLVMAGVLVILTSKLIVMWA